MADIVSPQKRSRIMSRIQGKNTRPELLIRKGLHSRGFRYRLHVRTLPGVPDMVFPKYRAVIFVNGCFWHRHNCHLFKWPSTRKEFWRQKIRGNLERDQRNKADLLDSGWRVLTVWECATKGKTRMSTEDLIDKIEKWLESGETAGEISGAGNNEAGISF